MVRMIPGFCFTAGATKLTTKQNTGQSIRGGGSESLVPGEDGRRVFKFFGKCKIFLILKLGRILDSRSGRGSLVLGEMDRNRTLKPSLVFNMGTNYIGLNK